MSGATYGDHEGLVRAQRSAPWRSVTLEVAGGRISSLAMADEKAPDR